MTVDGECPTLLNFTLPDTFSCPFVSSRSLLSMGKVSCVREELELRDFGPVTAVEQEEAGVVFFVVARAPHWRMIDP
jgi:hypothetical protein